jgi:hypothetical protein
MIENSLNKKSQQKQIFIIDFSKNYPNSSKNVRFMMFYCGRGNKYLY